MKLFNIFRYEAVEKMKAMKEEEVKEEQNAIQGHQEQMTVQLQEQQQLPINQLH